MNDIAVRFKEILEFIDSSAFPEKPLPVVLAQTYGQVQFGLAHRPHDPARDFYQIHTLGLEDYFEAGKKEHCFHVMLDADDRRWVHENRTLLPYTDEEILKSSAIHEVRHRLQYHLGIPLFTPSEISKVERCVLWSNAQANHYRNVPNGDRELDAKFFESYGAYEIRRGRLICAEDVKRLLFMTPQEFIDREKGV